MSDEQGRPDLEGSPGISRRDLIKRGAIVGGALVWATPVIESFTSPALAMVGTPPPPPPPPPPPSDGKDFSYIALVYTCAGKRLAVKFELDDDGKVTDCEVDNFNTPGCGFNLPNNVGADCSHFDVLSVDGTSVAVVFTSTAPPECTFEDGVGIGVCGNPNNPKSGGECVPGEISSDKKRITFPVCGE